MIFVDYKINWLKFLVIFTALMVAGFSIGDVMLDEGETVFSSPYSIVCLVLSLAFSAKRRKPDEYKF